MESEEKVAFLSHLDSEIKHYRERNVKVVFSFLTLAFFTFLSHGKEELPLGENAIYLILAIYLAMLFIIPTYISKTANKSRKLKSIRVALINTHFSNSYTVEVTSKCNVFQEFMSGGVNSFYLWACSFVSIIALLFFTITLIE